jgi:lipopolysaccharide export system protein LptA
MSKGFLFLFLLLSHLSYSQKKLEILHAGSLKFDEKLGNGAKRLIGDVQFKHDDVLMFCDSAYFYADNSLDAFGHVHVQQYDSIHLYGDLLKYNGNTKKAVVTNNVVVNKGDMQLKTTVLNYDIEKSIGFYTNTARIVNKENELISKQGYFFAKTNELFFKKEVVLTNQKPGKKDPEFVINCDTMQYNTSSKVTSFIGPTTIKSTSNLIYCEDGTYNTDKDLSQFTKNSYILTQDQKMFGDSLYYDGQKNIGRAIHNVQIVDSAQQTTIKGEYAIHYELQDLSIVTGKALLIKISENDTLYLHADTLKAVGENIKEKQEVKSEKIEVKSKKRETINQKIEEPIKKGDDTRKTAKDERREARSKRQEARAKNKEVDILKEKPGEKNKEIKAIDSIQKIDSVIKDTIVRKPKTENRNQHLFAYHKVKFFKKDLQGKCDSLIYSLNDSTMRLFGSPTLWSEENQLTADSIQVFTN